MATVDLDARQQALNRSNVVTPYTFWTQAVASNAGQSSPGELHKSPSPSGGQSKITTGLLDENGVVSSHFFEKEPVTLRYKSEALEREFFHHRAVIDTKRLVVCCVCLLLATGGYALQRWLQGNAAFSSLSLQFGFQMVIINTVGFVVEALLVHRVQPSYKVSTLREYLCTAYILVMIGQTAFFGARLVEPSQATCRWVQAYDDRPQDTDCPYTLIPLFLFTGLLPVVIGRPRFILSVPPVLIGVIICVVALTDAFTVVIRVVVLGGHAAFYLKLKHIEEEQQREQFETKLTISAQVEMRQTNELKLQEFALSITPPCLRRRLLNVNSQETAVDITENAIVLVVQVEDMARFSTSMLPQQAAYELGLFIARCSGGTGHDEEKPPLQHIYSVGDRTVLVGGLTEDPPPLLHAVYFALVLMRTSPNLKIRSGVATGHLIGMPVGSACIRYDVFGTALNDAEGASSSAPNSTCKVPQALVPSLQAADNSLYFEDPTSSGVIPSQCATDRIWECFDGQRKPDEPSIPALLDDAPEEDTIHLGPTNPFTGSFEHGGMTLDTQPNDTAISLNESLHFHDADAPVQLCLSPNRDTSTVPIIDHKRITKNFNPKAQHRMNLDMQSQLCCTTTFVDQEAAAAEKEHRFRYDKRAFELSCLFYGFMMVVVLGFIVGEKWQDVEASLIGSFILLPVCIAILFALAYHSHQQDTLSAYHGGSLMITSVLMLVGVSLSRPSRVSSDTAWMANIVCTAYIFSGLTPLVIVPTQVAWLVAYYLVSIAFKPLLTYGNALFVMAGIFSVGISIALYRDAQLKSLFAGLRLTEEAYKEVMEQEKLREAVVSGLIPRQLQSMIGKEALTTYQLNSWNRDESVVIHLSFMRGVVTEKELFNQWVRQPADCIKYMERMTSRIEAALRHCEHHCLDLVKVFGGTVVIAGPLTDPKSKSNGDDLSTAIEVSHAVKDCMHIVSELLRDEGKILSFTMGIAVEQTINVLRFSEFPAHDIFGPAVNVSRALMMEAPSPMVVVTEKLRNRFDEQMPFSRTSGLLMHKPETWRIRSIGSVRVCRIESEDTARNSGAPSTTTTTTAPSASSTTATSSLDVSQL